VLGILVNWKLMTSGPELASVDDTTRLMTVPDAVGKASAGAVKDIPTAARANKVTRWRRINITSHVSMLIWR
jgi:hypothetical protein